MPFATAATPKIWSRRELRRAGPTFPSPLLDCHQFTLALYSETHFIKRRCMTFNNGGAASPTIPPTSPADQMGCFSWNLVGSCE